MGVLHWSSCGVAFCVFPLAPAPWVTPFACPVSLPLAFARKTVPSEPYVIGFKDYSLLVDCPPRLGAPLARPTALLWPLINSAETPLSALFNAEYQPLLRFYGPFAYSWRRGFNAPASWKTPKGKECTTREGSFGVLHIVPGAAVPAGARRRRCTGSMGARSSRHVVMASCASSALSLLHSPPFVWLQCRHSAAYSD